MGLIAYGDQQRLIPSAVPHDNQSQYFASSSAHVCHPLDLPSDDHLEMFYHRHFNELPWNCHADRLNIPDSNDGMLVLPVRGFRQPVHFSSLQDQRYGKRAIDRVMFRLVPE